MAQAARLNLRMQKELKLLITDPPPGAAFPSLASETSSSSGISLSSIDAQIGGPEGSVYEKGIFKLKIQIPERYPFQPPIVTFVTPIYHPNIDTGGRICLDILNLPPKGAWQPSLNISTVLTSIGLLLSEPNPDDGLMHEASREYKYNRQVFDQKARSMTEKYAEVGASKVENVAKGSQTLPNPSTESAEATRSSTSITSVQDHFLSHKRFCAVGKKLSLESSVSDQKMNDGGGEIMGLKQESKATLFELNKIPKDLQETRKKLSLELLVPVQKKNDYNIIDVMPSSFLSQPHICSMGPSNSWPLVQPCFSSQQNPHVDKASQPTCNSTETRLKKDLQKPLAPRQGTGEDDKKLPFARQHSAIQYSGSHQAPLQAQSIIHQNERESHHDVAGGHGSNFSRIKHKKLGLSGRRLPQEQLSWNQFPEKDNKENMVPNSRFPCSLIEKNPTTISVVSETGSCYNNSVQISTNSSRKFAKAEQRKTSSPLVESNDMKDFGLKLEMQSEYKSRPSNMQNDSCDDKKQQPKDCGERFAAGVKDQEQSSPSAYAVIVLDSEDSEEEQGRAKRSKLSLVRRRLPGKRKS